jgi:hypothetical protein
VWIGFGRGDDEARRYHLIGLGRVIVPMIGRRRRTLSLVYVTSAWRQSIPYFGP